jgi:serine/threonine-protein kinase RsbW
MTATTNGNGALARQRTIDVRFPSDVRHIEHVIALVRNQCSINAVAARHCSLNVPVALAEALSNAIRSGNGGDPAKYVCVRSVIDGGRLVIDVADEGRGFDLQHAMRDPTRPENILREDGRGLFLMSRLMDRVERFNDDGNVVRMTLHLDAE